MRSLLIPTLVFISLLICGGALVIYGTFANNRWGVNTKAVRCPRCGFQLPRIREPKSREEILWGGSTCPSCGTRSDKWGRERS